MIFIVCIDPHPQDRSWCNPGHKLYVQIIQTSFVSNSFQSSDILLEIEFMRCELMVQSLGEKKENYSKAVVEVRSHKRHFL